MCLTHPPNMFFQLCGHLLLGGLNTIGKKLRGECTCIDFWIVSSIHCVSFFSYGCINVVVVVVVDVCVCVYENRIFLLFERANWLGFRYFVSVHIIIYISLQYCIVCVLLLLLMWTESKPLSVLIKNCFFE